MVVASFVRDSSEMNNKNYNVLDFDWSINLCILY